MGALHLTLASASPRRRDLLARLGVTPDAVMPADIDETPLKGERPRDYALRMGREKALAIGPDGWVLAGDTVVAVGRRILPKTEEEHEARAAHPISQLVLPVRTGTDTFVVPDVEACLVQALELARAQHHEDPERELRALLGEL